MIALLLFNFAFAALNQTPLTATATLTPAVLSPGENGTVKLQLELQEGFHAYLDQFHIETGNPDFTRVGKLSIQPIHQFNDPFSKRVRDVFEGKSELIAPFELAGDSDKLSSTSIKLIYQACTKDYCLFPQTLLVPIHFTVRPAPVQQRSISFSESLNRFFQTALTNNLALAFLLVFIAGILTSLTPCIFPMIPVTLAVIGGRRMNVSRRTRFLMSVFYVFGIAITYSLLGVVVASTGALFGEMLGNPIVIGLIAMLFVAMGISMAGVFETTLPLSLQNKLSNIKGPSGFVGALVSGLLAGVIASPCVGPVLVTILTYVAEKHDVVLGFSLLFVFALGLGQIFLLLGFSTRFLERLPRSGPWMDSVKNIFAVSFFGLAVWYLRPLLSMPILFVGSAVVCLVAAYLFRQVVVRAVFVALAVCAVYFAFQNKPAVSRLAWQPYSEALLERSQKDGKAVLIDINADWCVACHELELSTFSDARIEAVFGTMTLLKFNATQSSDELDKIKKRYDIHGLPHLIFYDEHGQYRKDLTLTGFESADLFLGRLGKLKE